MPKSSMEVALGSDESPPVSHVVALTIVSLDPEQVGGTDSMDVLIGVRRPECNGNHKNIASVPTKRVPERVFSTIKERWRGSLRSLEGVAEEAQGGQAEDEVYDTVESILSRKVGLADHLEYGRVKFSAEPFVYRAGASPLLGDGDRPEELRMINLLVRLREGRDLIPASTASYSALKWFSCSEVVSSMGEGRRLSFEGVGPNVTYACGGLCVCTAEVLLRNHRSCIPRGNRVLAPEMR